jgi:hypothetical protein
VLYVAANVAPDVRAREIATVVYASAAAVEKVVVVAATSALAPT